MAFTKKQHELGWTDEVELAYMVKRMTKPDGTVQNMMTLFRLMGYNSKVVPQSFKDRVEKVKSLQ